MNFIARIRERLAGWLRTSSQRDSAASDDLDDLADVLDESRRAVWATVATAARRCDGRLMGGTALAVHLRHRASMDFDVFTVEDFYHPHVVNILRAGGHDYDSHMVRHNSVTVELDGVMVQIYKDTAGAGAAQTNAIRIADALNVHGMPIGSIQDVFASKLNAVRYRSAERDLFDVWDISFRGHTGQWDCGSRRRRRHQSGTPAGTRPPYSQWDEGLLAPVGVIMSRGCRGLRSWWGW